MKVNLNIRQKMLVNILTTSIVIFAIVIGYMSYKSQQLILDDAKKMALSITKENALEIKKILDEDLSMLKTLSASFSLTGEIEEQEWKDLYAKMSKDVFVKRDNLFSFTASWEEGSYKSEEGADPMRFITHVSRNGDEIELEQKLVDLTAPFYQEVRSLNKNALLDPYRMERANDSTMLIRLVSPIKEEGDFVGCVVGEFMSDIFHSIVLKIKPYPQTVACLVGNSGVLVSHPVTNYIGDTLYTYTSHFEEQFNLSEAIRDGEAKVFAGTNKQGEKVLLVTTPIEVGDYAAPWALTLVIPQDSILHEANKSQRMSLLVSIIGLLIITSIIYLRATDISQAIRKTTEVLDKLSKGDIENTNNEELDRGDEIGKMADSVTLLKNNLNETSEFAEKIGEGHLNAEFKSLGDQDKLGNSLLEMQENLKKAKAVEEEMKSEEAKAVWASDGFARFGDIIRANNDDIETLTYGIVKNLVDYLGVSLGALYVAETVGDEVFYTAKAAVAYEQSKMSNTKYRVGESLIGRCAHEKLSVYLTDIPEDYLVVKSGLGGIKPTSLLLVPLKVEDEVLGVLELASLNQIEDYKVKFVEELSEIIASTLSSTQINQRTAKLLEQSKMQGEELAAQEEEMRQNMEELQATQEEAARREQEMTSVLNAIDKSVFKVEYDYSGKITSINDRYKEFIGEKEDRLLDSNIESEYALLGIGKTEYTKLWDKLKNGASQEIVINVKIGEGAYKVNEHYTPMMDKKDGMLIKVLKVGYLVS